ncbi:hypothetical protein ABZ512_06620 [Nocardiopsis dassonvillei]|uniref:hypothetical protein n=1 Tax=Nocardiopsis dassonvillei TaxID=2014 RepID=UPI003409374E
MSTTTAVSHLAARIHAIDWDGDVEHTRSRVALMREYLRRSAVWTRALGTRGWPFYDIAEFAAPGVRAADEVVEGVLESPVVIDQYPTVGRSCVWALHLAAARDAGVPLPDLPDPFEPLIRMYERGGGFSLSTTGTIDIDTAGLYRGRLPDHLGDEPRAPETEAGLDALDGVGGCPPVPYARRTAPPPNPLPPFTPGFRPKRIPGEAGKPQQSRGAARQEPPRGNEWNRSPTFGNLGGLDTQRGGAGGSGLRQPSHAEPGEGVEGSPMGLAWQQELVRDMALELVEAAPDGWTSMNYRYDYIGSVAASENLVTFENGGTERKRHPRSVDKKAKFLKSEMYQEGKGTWLGMSISVTRPGKFNAQFHYDKELGVHPIPPSPDSYVFELGKFPRNDDALSDWLRKQIDQARG